MGIRAIDYALCNGCGICVDICPLDVLRVGDDGEKPVVKYLRDCQNCFHCEVKCPTKAIYVTPFRERRTPSPFAAVSRVR